MAYFGNTRKSPWCGRTSGGNPRQKRTNDTPQEYFSGHYELLRASKAKRVAAGKKKKEEQGHSAAAKHLEMVAKSLDLLPPLPVDTKVAVTTAEE